MNVGQVACHLGAVLALLIGTSSAYAAESTALVQGRDVITMPGIGRVILAFMLTAVLAVTIAVVLKRVLPKFGARMPSSGSLRVVDRANLSAGLRVHVLQVDDEKVIVAESRNGVALLALGQRREQA